MEVNNIITKEGLKELNEELKLLVDVERSKVIQEIKEARAQGDLKENAEFDAAREKQGKIEDRIAEIERIIASSKIIKTKKTSVTNISIGSVVEVQIEKKNHTYQIVGPLEADPFEGKISNVSPLGSALLGKKKGDEATFVIENDKNRKKIVAKIESIKSK